MTTTRGTPLCTATALFGWAWLAPVAAVHAQADAPTANLPSTLQVEEVVVTAMRREQSLQDVPIAVTALQGADLERIGAVNYTDLTNYVPNFSFNALTNAGFIIPALRGIGLTGSTESAISNNPATGIYIDGVYLNSTAANLFNVLDVARVEVLRGPQGTLYGRNTIGGVVNIISSEPTQELTGKFNASYGNENRVQVGGSLSAPIVDGKLYGRLGASYVSRDGYVDNRFSSSLPNTRDSGDDTDSLRSVATRGSISFLPTDRLKLVLAADYARDETTYPGYNVEDGASPDLSSLLGPAAGSYTDLDGDVHAISNNANNEERSTNWGASVTGTWSGEAIRVVSITGYRESDYLDELSDIDGTPINIFQQYLNVEETGLSEELRVHYDSGPVHAVVGLFYNKYDARQDSANDILGVERDLGYPLGGGVGPGLLGGGITRSVVDIETESQSIFGHASYDLSDRWSVEAGLRWTETTMDFSRPVSRVELGDQTNPFYSGGNAFDELPAGVQLIDIGTTFGKNERKFSKVTPKVGVNLRPVRDVLVYASWSRGFREGGFAANPSNPSGILSFGPETLTSYEIGTKATVLDGRVRLNGAIYYYDYSDQQVEVATIAGGGLFADIYNSGESEARGAELEFAAYPFEFLELQGSLGWQDTEFKKLDAGIAGDLSGNEFPRAPEFTASLIPTLSFDVGSMGKVSFRPEWHYRSSEFMTVTNDPLVRGPARDLVNATLSWEPAAGDWAVSLWSKNLTDEEYITKVVDLSTFFGYRLRRYGEPRSYGLSVRYSF